MSEDPLKDAVNRRGNKRGMNPNSRKNLAKGQFKKGQVSNPRGRPPNELSLTNLTREMLTQPCPHDSQGRTWKEYLVDKWLELAAQNPAYFRELIDRVEGRTPLLVSQDSRNVTIVVQDEKTRPLIEHAGDRTRALMGPVKNEDVDEVHMMASEHDKENLLRAMAGERTRPGAS